MKLISTSYIFIFFHLFFSLIFTSSLAGIPTKSNEQPLNPMNYSNPNSIPAFPVQTKSQTCHLDLSTELFGGVREACDNNLDRSRCCPVLAAWLFAAHARTALQISKTSLSDLDPMMPDDSQKCVNSLKNSLENKNIKIPQPNETCDPILCFCGIRLHQISSLSCSTSFNISGYHNNASPTEDLKNLEMNCRNSSYSGCSKCLGALQKLKGREKNETREDRESKMFNRDCQLMGLTWLLARNKTAYIPTVSAVLRAIMYNGRPQESKCSHDQENMPLAVDSLHFQKTSSSFSSCVVSSFSNILLGFLSFTILVLSLITRVFY